VTATLLKRAVFSKTGPMMDPTEWTSSYTANDADWFFLSGPAKWGSLYMMMEKFNLRNDILKKSNAMNRIQNSCQVFVTQL
jgi:hypothetical protein